jgi:membrane protease YdiL (CAAX protease family)
MTAPAITTIARPASVGRRDLVRIVGAAGGMFVILQGGLTLLVGRLDQTTSAIAVTSAMLGTALVIERGLFGRGPREALRSLGWGRPSAGSIATAAIVGCATIAFLPLYAVVTGTPMTVKPDWAWVLLGAIALNGLAEETLFRGFVFGHLRQAGYAFRTAGLISLAIFAAVHLFLFTSNPPAVAFLALVLSVAAAFPLAFLYERAGNVIWAGVLLHVAMHAFRMVSVPDAQLLPLASAWIALQIVGVFAVYLFRDTLLRRR